MERSEQLDKLAPALCKAQSELKSARKEATNPHLRSKYADLGNVWDACRETLAKYELAVVQTFEPAPEGKMALRTTLLHSSGQYLSGVCEMPLAKLDPQTFGAASTYARRYGLSALLGIVADEDDDGHSASQQPAHRAQERPPAQGAAFRPPSAPAATPAPSGNGGGTLPMDDAGACPHCHAPAGRPHGNKCPTRSGVGQ